MTLAIKQLFFKEPKVQAFAITRLNQGAIEESVLLKKGRYAFDITQSHGMICLDPFCVAAWLPDDKANLVPLQTARFDFIKRDKLNASIKVSLIETIATQSGKLLLFKIAKVRNYQLTALHRLVFFSWLLRSKANTYFSRRVISALYSYPRSIIIVSYQDAHYYNIFPMDIHAYIKEEGLYILGLRTTNVALEKILAAKKVVVCDTDTVDIDTVYKLGKHPSNNPRAKEEMPFSLKTSELFGFPVPDFAGQYKEIEITAHRLMGYHMLMVGKVLNAKQMKQQPESLYHVGFLQYQMGDYKQIAGLF